MATAVAGSAPQQGLPRPFAFQKQGLGPLQHKPLSFARTEPPMAPRDNLQWIDTRPYNPLISGQALLRAGLIAALGFGLAFMGGRRFFNKSFQKTAQHNASLNTEALTHKTTFLNFQNPILSLMTMANNAKFWPVAGLYGLTSVGGYLISTTLKGIQAAWVRDEQTQTRMRSLDTIAQDIGTSMLEKETYLHQLKQDTWQAIQQLLVQHGINNNTFYNPLTGKTPRPAINLNASRNYLQEVRSEKLPNVYVNFGAGLASTTALSSSNSLQALGANLHQLSQAKPGFVDRQLLYEQNDTVNHKSEEKPRFRLNIADPIFLGLGTALGFSTQGLKQTWRHLVSVLSKTDEEITQKAKEMAEQGMQPIKRSLTITLKDSEALVMLLSDLGKTRLLIGMGLLVGAFGAGKLLIDGLREIKVYQQNAKAEINYQRYNWRNLGFKLQRTAEETWLNVQLNALNDELPELKNDPKNLKARINSIIGHIGLNSPPSYYTTPVEFNEPYYWHYADN